MKDHKFEIEEQMNRLNKIRMYISDKELYSKSLEIEEQQNRINRLKKKERARFEEEKKQKYLLQTKEHSTGLITWKNIPGTISWEGFYKGSKFFEVNYGVYKYSLKVMPAVKKKFIEETKNTITSFELTSAQKSAENMMNKIIQAMDKENKMSGA